MSICMYNYANIWLWKVGAIVMKYYFTIQQRAFCYYLSIMEHNLFKMSLKKQVINYNLLRIKINKTANK